MATYEIEIDKRLMKTVTLTVPDHISAEDVEEWAEECVDELFDVERYQGTVKWDVSDLSEGEEVPVELAEKFDDYEYEIQSFDKK